MWMNGPDCTWHSAAMQSVSLLMLLWCGCWLPLFLFRVLWVESSSLCSPSFFPALCLSCVCLVFLDCGGLPLYGRWTAIAGTLDPGAEGGFLEWQAIASLALFCLVPTPDYISVLFCYDSLRMKQWQADVSHEPQRGESNHLTHCFWDNVTVTLANMRRIGSRDGTFNTINLYACDKGHGPLFGRHEKGRWWNCMTLVILATLSSSIWSSSISNSMSPWQGFYSTTIKL